MTEYVVRFLVGGVVVSAFAMLGDMLRPKSFAGLFGAAPSVALATLGIAVYRHGASYAAQQSWAMTAGAIALAVYGLVVCQLLIRARLRAAPATLLSLVVWLIVAFGLFTLAGGQHEPDRLFAFLAQGRPLVRIPGPLRARRAATVFTGLISSRYGASVGGLFLALPAIFFASATLIEKHEIRRKREAGLDGRRRGEEAAALDSAGAALGALGMLVFAIVFSVMVERSIPGAFIGASLAWLVVSVAAWCVRCKMRWVRRTDKISGPADFQGR